ncbi:aldo/keto reductase [Lichenicola sp.]|uniref:aldo/keto reductase n=1 Tax=Lichenicola sp. TaxID=2804529 RepID=UPI003B00881D
MGVGDRRMLPRRAVSPTGLGLGCAQMGGLFRPMPLRDCEETVQAAWDAGIRYFDTAPYYGYSRSERRLGTILDGFPRDEYVLSSKVGRLMLPDAAVGADEDGWVRPLPFRPTYDYSHDGILRSFEVSRQRLGCLRIDILYVHDIGRVTHGDRHAQYWSQLTTGGGFRALAELRDSGQVGAVGLGVNECEVVADAMQAFDLDVTMLAGRYTLLEQASAGFLEACHRNGNAIIAAGVFNSGVLVGNTMFNYAEAPPDIIRRVRALQQACDAFDVPLPAAALQFPVAHPAITSCVVGAHSAAQLRTSIGWFDHPIPDAFWANLKQQGLIDPAAPTGNPGEAR